jgi:2-polyprenyl-3-methyl-5-hydroxy-6-metoxy-1,4-benzoquinol methylase
MVIPCLPHPFSLILLGKTFDHTIEGNNMTRASARERLEEGERLFFNGYVIKAQEIFESLIREDGASKEALNDLGVIAHQHGDTEKAFHYFVRALHVDPHYQEAIDNLCHLRGELERNRSAVERIQGHETQGTRAAANTVSSSVHHLDLHIRLIANRKDYLVGYCKSKSVIHLGCVGSGSVEERFRDGSHLHLRLSRVTSSLVGVDINAQGIAAMKRAGFDKCLVKDVERDGIDPELITHMDVILVPEVLEHLSNPGHFLDHLKRLNYPGDIVFSVPNAFSYRTHTYIKKMRVEFVHPDHHFYFSPTTLRTFFKKHGFSTISQVLYYWPSRDAFGEELESELQNHPYLAEGIIAIVKDCRHVEGFETSLEQPKIDPSVGRRGPTEGPLQKADRNQTSSIPYKLYYSQGIAHHGEKMRRMLGLDHYVPSIHINEPVWFFGLYFDQDYLQVLGHQGKKIINWRGSDTFQLKASPARLRLIKDICALHVCQSDRQQAVLAEFGIKSIVRSMINEVTGNITVTPFPEDRTRILVFWKRGIDDFIRADLFFEITSKSQDVEFHIVGDEDPNRFIGAGKENLIYHGFLSEQELNGLMDRCKGTLRPWISDGTPNIQTKMVLKGRYAAHSCQFEKVALCRTVDDYVAWIEWLKGVTVPNLEARDWWLRHLNNFDFLHPDFDFQGPSLREER